MRYSATAFTLAMCFAAFVPGAAAAGQSAAPSAPLPVVANAQAEFKARCRKNYISAEPSAVKWADGACAEDWKKVVAAGPAANALLQAISAKPGASLADTKARLPGISWGKTEPSAVATGKLGAFTVSIHGKGVPASVSAGWMKVGEPIPFDIPGAMMARGVKLTPASCEKLGVGEGNRVWAGSAPGRAPFTLAIDSREAPTGDANSYYSASVSLDGKLPKPGNLSQCREF